MGSGERRAGTIPNEKEADMARRKKLTKAKARKILHDKGSELTEKARGFMGARASGAPIRRKAKRRR